MMSSMSSSRQQQRESRTVTLSCWKYTMRTSSSSPARLLVLGVFGLLVACSMGPDSTGKNMMVAAAEAVRYGFT